MFAFEALHLLLSQITCATYSFPTFKEIRILIYYSDIKKGKLLYLCILPVLGL